jgi:hypothetical protein
MTFSRPQPIGGHPARCAAGKAETRRSVSLMMPECRGQRLGQPQMTTDWI